MRARQIHSERRDSGMTLFETMISLAVMSIAMTIVASTLILVQRATTQMEASSSAIDEARLLSASLDRELRSADCISSPGDNAYSTTLTFRTTINRQAPVMLTYQLDYGEGTENGTVTRQEGAGTPRPVVTVVGPQPTGPIAGPFKQVSTPGPSLRTLVVNIPIRSSSGGVFQLVTTVAGRNSWRPCT
jgi:prepilin-type N-terminal cleavage/methylation domain-containing protein